MWEVITPVALISVIVIGVSTVGYTLYSILEELRK